MPKITNLPATDRPLDALVIAPHPDDAELGMGGTVVKLLRRGWRVGILDLTDGEPTPHGTPEIRQRETNEASQALGVAWRYNLGMRNRFLEPTIENRQQIAEVFRLTRPRWLFAPYWEDAHPDHLAATQLVEAARFWSKLSKSEMAGEPFHPEKVFYYYCIHLKLVLQPAFIVDISDEWDAKFASIEAYESQFIKGRESMNPSFLSRLKDEASYWGKMIGTRYGEPFASREPIGLHSLDALRNEL
ncbi:MAG: bacillithiol biosynthesis deacetylase BshB1 [Pirellulaceae bacterium]|nr:bacillithiol biosynthesis deacetylase BshB1 [Pirellulaceae bacterium]